MSDGVDIRLSDDEALVLLDLLSRWFEESDFEESDHVIPAGAFAHDAERAVLDAVLTGQLEKQVAVIFAKNYAELVDQARQRLSLRYPPISN